ncbi:hypothetical protein [Massilia sp. DD77]|uniref:hypothetical protein n=1 Tax=Massilia sp. DD77 TaxID=3109349 RepID=UPI003000372E
MDSATSAGAASPINQFARFLADRWIAGLEHRYDITRHRAWNTWRALNGGRSIPWTCTSLSQAAQHWSWREPPRKPFSDLAHALQMAMAADDDAAAAACCHDIFEWGDVARDADAPSRQWVADRARAGRLCNDLHAAVHLLAPGSTAPLDRFTAGNLWMNSATTKLYAAADPVAQTAIYDGRVGAALGMLARQFLEEQKVNSVPAELAFMWGAPQSASQAALRTRDPSTERHVFRKLPNGVRSHRPRAELGRNVNTLFGRVIEILAERGLKASMLELERACLMIGYRLR